MDGDEKDDDEDDVVVVADNSLGTGMVGENCNRTRCTRRERSTPRDLSTPRDRARMSSLRSSLPWQPWDLGTSTPGNVRTRTPRVGTDSDSREISATVWKKPEKIVRNAATPGVGESEKLSRVSSPTNPTEHLEFVAFEIEIEFVLGVGCA